MQREKKQQGTSRREFLKKTSAAATAAATLGGLTIERAAHAAGSDVLKIGLVGCGGRGTGAVRDAINSGHPVKLVAMADAFDFQLQRSLERLMADENLRKHIDVPPDRQFVGLDAYKHVCQSDVDVVILATPPGFRPVQFAEAIRNNKHVFAEKPIATDAPGVRLFLAANEEAKRKGLAVGIGLQRHHQAVYIETMKRLKDGAIGDINFMRAYWNGAGVWVRDRLPGMNEMQYQVWNWYYFVWTCGDHIVEQHIHNIDVINWLKDAHPIKAQGQGGRQVRVDKKYGQIYDHHFVEFTYPDGSVMLSQCRHIPGCWNSVSEHAHGSEGYCHIGRGVIYDKKGEVVWRYRGRARSPYVQEHYDLYSSILSGNPLNEGDYGAYSTMTAIMGRMATYSGKEVTWETAFNSNLNLQPAEYSWDAEPPVKPDENGYYPVATPGVTIPW